VTDVSHFIEPTATSPAPGCSRVRCLPSDDTILQAVADPNVGKDRDTAVEAKDWRFPVGPDNGLLSAAWSDAGAAP
jgi:S-adenosylmethionine hydrolase